MHEYSLAEDIAQIAAKTLVDNDGKIVKEIELEIGKMSGVEIEALRFALEIVLEHSFSYPITIKIDETPGMGYCSNCKAEYILERIYTPCPICNAYCSSIVKGKEFKVKTISIE